jgi:hypothetical protein
MAISRFSNSSIANGFPKYQKFWDQTTYGGIVTNGLLMHVDAGNEASYSGSGSTWTDISGNGRHITLSGTSYSSTDGGGIVFTGSSGNGTFNMGGVTTSYTAEAVVYAAAFNSDGSGSSGIMYWTDNSQGHGFIMEVDETTPRKWRFAHRYPYGTGASTDDFSSSTSPTAGKYHVMYVRNGSTSQKIYVNGTEVASATPVYGGFDSSLTIGTIARVTNTNTNRHWDGRMHQIRIYNRALSAAEVAQNYNFIKGKFGI